MAGEIDLRSVSALPTFEVARESVALKLKEAPQPGIQDEAFETPDVSAQRRKALEDAITKEGVTDDGKFVIEKDPDTGRFIQKIIDPTTGETLDQWPDEKFLELVKYMDEAYGLLVDKNV